jgi:o-succinylbenzoate synthase
MLNFFKYQVPFTKPFKTSIGEFDHREGILITFKENEITAFGEVAPLPGFSTETFNQVLSVLNHNKEILEQAFKNNETNEIISVIDKIHAFSSVSFGLDTLNLDLQAKRNAISLGQQLFSKDSEPVNSNAAIGLGSQEEIITEVEGDLKSGFNTFKLKVGQDFEKEYQILQQVRNRFPDIKIRIDANGAWDVEQAIKNLNKLAPLHIEYCEQPVQKDLKSVTEQVSIPVAADESVRSLNDAMTLIESGACDLLIIKPALFGRLNDLIVTKELANTHNKEVVLTTAFDGIVGRTITAVLASGLGSRKYAHGLSTGSLLKETVRHTEIKNGFFDLFPDQGLGYPIELSNLNSLS